MTVRAVTRLADTVAERSNGRCEAVWALIDWTDRGVPDLGDRCPRQADVIHHRLPRARARHGAEHLLDVAEDADNLAHLCGPCHDRAHGNPLEAAGAWLSGDFGAVAVPLLRPGIVVEGEVRSGLEGFPRYTGPHPDYQQRYP